MYRACVSASAGRLGRKVCRQIIRGRSAGTEVVCTFTDGASTSRRALSATGEVGECSLRRHRPGLCLGQLCCGGDFAVRRSPRPVEVRPCWCTRGTRILTVWVCWCGQHFYAPPRRARMLPLPTRVDTVLSRPAACLAGISTTRNHHHHHLQDAIIVYNDKVQR